MFENAKVTNIKISIKCDFKSLDSVEKDCLINNILFKRHNNFIVFREKYVYTIFRSKDNLLNHINITSIKQKSEIESSIIFLSDVLKIVVKSETLTIDNITGSMNVGKEIFLTDIIKKIKYNFLEYEIFVKYNNETFPGLFLKVKKNSEKIGTIIIFHSAKVIFVGVKKTEDLKCLESLTIAVTNMK